MAYDGRMGWLFLIATLACNIGDRLVDLSAHIPRGTQSISVLISVYPFYTRLYFYQPGFPESFQGCCGDRASSVLTLPVIDGRYCIRQSQPQMKWKVQIIFRPGTSI